MTDTNSVPEWTLDGVLAELAGIHASMTDRQFAFILGAGASFTSDIPTGKHLAQRWLKDLHLRECDDGSDLDDWLSQAWPSASGLSHDTADQHYPQIFERRFSQDRESGYAELELAMEGKSPSLGYSLLAEIIQHTRHKVVVTTNFDNLVADALAMHAHQSPLVVAHESLAGFVRPQLRRPLVAKIHRDLFLHPKNDHAGVSTMEEGWRLALKKLFQYFTPIVVGYGGNDGSLMDMLLALEAGDIAGRMVWCYREGAPPSDKAQQVLIKHRGVQVKIAGFDEFMLQLAAKLVKGFNVADIAERTAKLGQDRATRYREQAEKLSKSSAQGSAAQRSAGVVLRKSIEGGKSWWAWQVLANDEPDVAKQEEIYKQGLREFPTSAELTANYALFLAQRRKEYVAAQTLYRKALELDPSHAHIAGNYAVFLADLLKDFDAAQFMFKKALELDPGHASIMGDYAYFLAQHRKDYDAAEGVYQKAMVLAPSDASIACDYALFLKHHRKDYDAAQTLFKKALELDPGRGDITGAYALFLANHRKDYDDAEAMYKRARELDPENPNHIANFASLKLTKGDPTSRNEVRPLVLLAISRRQPEASQTLAEAILYGAIERELRAAGADEELLGRLKSLLQMGFERGIWDFEPMFSVVLPQLPAERQAFFRALGAAILDASQVGALDKFENWQSLKPIDPFGPFAST